MFICVGLSVFLFCKGLICSSVRGVMLICSSVRGELGLFLFCKRGISVSRGVLDKVFHDLKFLYFRKRMVEQ